MKTTSKIRTTSKMKTNSKMKMTSKIKTTSKMKMKSKLTKSPNFYQLSKPEIEFDMMKEMYAALGIHMFRLLRQRQLNHKGRRLWDSEPHC